MKVHAVDLITTDNDWAAVYIDGELENETHSFDAQDLIELLQHLNGKPMSLHTKHLTEAASDAMLEDGNGFPALLADIAPESFTG